jgi:hypothetical protein
MAARGRKPVAFTEPIAATESVGSNDRLTVPLTTSGEIDWTSMRDSTRARLLAIASDDQEILTEIGMGGWVKPGEGGEGGSGEVTGEDILPEITEANIHEAIDLLSQTNALVFKMAAARFIKHPILRDQQGRSVPLLMDQDILSAAFTLDEAQHKELDPRATRLAKKNTPEWLKKNLDLYLFAGMFLKFTTDNCKEAMKLQVQRDIKKAQAAQIRASVKPIPVETDAPTNSHPQAQPGSSYEGVPLQPGNTSIMEGTN